MGRWLNIFRRSSRLAANIAEDALDKAETFDRVVNETKRAMRESVRRIKESKFVLAETLTLLDAQEAEQIKAINTFNQAAQAAMAQEDEQTARKMIMQRQRAQARLQMIDERRKNIQPRLVQAEEQVENLTYELDNWLLDMDVMRAMIHADQSTIRAGQLAAGTDAEGIGDRLSEAIRQAKSLTARAEAYSEESVSFATMTGTNAIEAQAQKLALNSAVDDELAVMRRQLTSGGA